MSAMSSLHADQAEEQPLYDGTEGMTEAEIARAMGATPEQVADAECRDATPGHAADAMTSAAAKAQPL